MTSLRTLIEAKQRRTAKLPVLVGDLASAAAEVETFRGALRIHQDTLRRRREEGVEPTDADAERGEQLREQLKAAQERQAATVVEVELEALDDDVWDAVLDPIEEGPEGLDLSEVRAELIAASCVDEELRDPKWWAEQFARDVWSKGDLLAVNSVLIDLNLNVPAGHSGKG